MLDRKGARLRAPSLVWVAAHISSFKGLLPAVGCRSIDAYGKLENGGEYTAAWRKTDGVWSIYSELFVGLYCHGADCQGKHPLPAECRPDGGYLRSKGPADDPAGQK